ncbi:MAG: MFS transporter [Armatimonadota bacterium]
MDDARYKKELPASDGQPAGLEKRYIVYAGTWPATLRALRHRNFRYFWFGQLISLIGTWMQSLAQQWLVLQLVGPVNTSLYIGLVSTIGSLPMLFLSLYAGVIADRYDKRCILIVTQTAFMLLALGLAALVWLNMAQLWLVMLFAALSGTVMAFDMPTRQAFVKDMVGPEDLLNAIALNSSIFNGARIIGPAVAGGLIALHQIGISGAFFLNGLSFIAVIFGLLLIRTPFTPRLAGSNSTWQHLQEGFQYVKSHRTLRLVMILMAIYSVFGFSYIVLMPVIAKSLNKGADSLGLLIGSTGVGAFIGAVLLASLAGMVRKGRILLTGGLTFCVAMIAFSQGHFLFPNPHNQFIFSLLVLPFVGAGLILASSSINSLVQEIAPDHLRGRVVSIWAFIFAGFTPIAGVYAGVTANFTTPMTAILIGALACFVAISLLTIRAPWIWRLE